MREANVISPKNFIIRAFIAVVILLGVIAYVNVKINIFGLFGEVKGKKIQVYDNERISKYLLSYHYIPQNYNTVIIGTSLSDNLNVTQINQQDDSLRVYNASIMGANISELLPIITKLTESGVIDNVILCLSPYLLKDSGSKVVTFNDKLYYGALGSVNLYEIYAVGIIREYGLMPNKYPKNQINHDGVNDYDVLFHLNDVEAKIREQVIKNGDTPIPIDSVAYQEFLEMIQLLKDRKVNYMGYFHPLPKDIYNGNKQHLDAYKKVVSSVVGTDRVLDFNTPEFADFTADFSNYIDHGHLSRTGQAFVVKTIFNRFRAQKK